MAPSSITQWCDRLETGALQRVRSCSSMETIVHFATVGQPEIYLVASSLKEM